jgi:hypothetical protein
MREKFDLTLLQIVLEGFDGEGLGLERSLLSFN